MASASSIRLSLPGQGAVEGNDSSEAPCPSCSVSCMIATVPQREWIVGNTARSGYPCRV